MFDLKLEHIFSYTASLNNPPEVIGPVAEGIRVNFYVSGGAVSGPKVNGRILPVGGDWLTLRKDGVGILDVRATMETSDGALIYTAYSGIVDFGEDGYDKFLKQELPPIGNLRIAPRYFTAHPGYQWLNRIQCVGIGQSDISRSEVGYDIYALV
ncbi:MAG: DUF3237 domain-containing protein [Acidobacteriota bacterium]|nr:MAG: DUF3237 domain-containing protein [Acidobacteriota bacterium]